MAKRIDDQQRVITFVMEGELSAVESALKTANAIFASRRKQATGLNGAPAAKPTVVRRRKTTSEPTAVAAAASVQEDQLAL